MPTSNSAVNSSGSTKEAPFSSHAKCLGLILFDKLNEKYCGNSLSSMRSRRISHMKKSIFGLKFSSMLGRRAAETYSSWPAHRRWRTQTLQGTPAEKKLLLDAAGEKQGMLHDWGDAEHLEEVEGGAEATDDVGNEETTDDVGNEEARATTSDTVKIATLDVGFAEEEGNDGDVVDEGDGEDLIEPRRILSLERSL
ncbi:hypothetical protein BHE74_00052679 [Ensete ventricosum]|nr:hypothetical protein BHE74_00052679 [Ensete ventricosum]